MRTKAKKNESSRNQVRADPPAQNLDGKTQPIGQYKLTSKKPGKNTEVMQQDWKDSITIAQSMLVAVNQELENILEEFSKISEALAKLNTKLGVNDAVTKINNINNHINNAFVASNTLLGDFKKLIAGRIKDAATEIKKIAPGDLDELKKLLKPGEVEKLNSFFIRIKLLEKSMSTNSQAVNPNSEREKRNKAHQQITRILFSLPEDNNLDSDVSVRTDDSD